MFAHQFCQGKPLQLLAADVLSHVKNSRRLIPGRKVDGAVRTEFSTQLPEAARGRAGEVPRERPGGSGTTEA